MRRWMGMILSLVMLMSAAVANAEPEAQPAAWDDGDYLTPGVFSIDGAYTQEGMNAPYEAGYAPRIDDDELRVTLPLQASGKIDGDIIYCSLDLGDRDRSPFVYNNYQSIPVRPRYENTDGNEVATSLYVADFTLPLKDNRENGVYPLIVEIRYKTEQEEKTQVFTIDFTVSGQPAGGEPSSSPGEDPGDDPGGSGYDPGGGSGYDPGGDVGGGYDPGVSDPGGGSSVGGAEEPVSEPKVILESATAAPDPCDAGEPFTVTCTLRNTSKKQPVSNMTVTYKSQTTDLIPLGGANTQYIENIGADKTVQFAFQMESRLDAASGPQKIDLALAYEGKNGTAYTAADEITVLIRQKLRLEFDDPTFPASVYIGDSINATLNLYNKGKGTLYNVTVSMDVPGIEPESSSFVGNMESGSSKSADIYATVVGLPMEIPDESEEEPIEETTPQDEDFAAGEGIALPEEKVAAGGAVALSPEGEFTVGEAVAFGSEIGSGAGESEGEFLITYEDEFGDVYDEHVPLSTMIMEMEYIDEPMEEPMTEEPESTGMPWWGWALIGGGAAAVAIPVGVRAKKKKRAQELEEDLEDDDIY